MTVKRFIIFILLWSILPLMAVSDLGGIVGFILIWVVIMFAIPVMAFVQLVGPESIWAKVVPATIGGLIAAFILYALLKQIIGTIIAFSRKDMMRARRKFVYGYAMATCIATSLLCLFSLARQWP
ncbi:hypothetical protein [Litorimonas sp. WD9-15]|uniref:hypothetical protein n=1 Tax=Litorimonas sp. WD9-15 TaxID=3418716 RepID=UPI003D088E8F